ncbi:MAG: hypothetical protein AB7E81_20590 [Hyphomicrobiaceae bacterium]
MSPTNTSALPIEALIGSRLRELGLRPIDIVRACGYKNVSKGLRRFSEFRAGYFAGTSWLADTLPTVLDISRGQIDEAIEATEQYFEKAQEAAYREAFVPHAIVKTDRKRPEPLFVAFAIGVERLIYIEFDLEAGPVTFPRQAIAGVAKKLAEWKSNILPAFGRPTGVFVNYSPDRAIEFDLRGNPVKEFNQSIRPGEVQLKLSGREITEDEKRLYFGS